MTWSRSILSVRGSSLLAAGVATGAAAIILGEVDLLRIAVVFTLLVIVCWIWMGLSGLRLRTAHRPSVLEAPVGTPIDVEIWLQARSALPLPSLECVDRTSDGLGSKPTLIVDAKAARSGVSMHYICSAKTRGRHRLGPLSLTVTDAFGIVTTTKTGTEYVNILGLPVVEHLGERWSLRHVGRTGNERTVAVAGPGQFDAALRDHQPLDGLRRVHWRSSARQGKLMVRQDEQLRERLASLVVDDREVAHNEATFDHMMSAAASVGVHLLRADYQITTYGSSGQLLPGYGAWSETGWVRTLALTRPSPGSDLPGLAEALHVEHEVGPIFLFITESSAPDSALLERARSRNTPAVAIVLETTPGSTSHALRQMLLRNKWKVVAVPLGARLADCLDVDGPREPAETAP